jgi:hypothetical protein
LAYGASDYSVVGSKPRVNIAQMLAEEVAQKRKPERKLRKGKRKGGGRKSAKPKRESAGTSAKSRPVKA